MPGIRDRVVTVYKNDDTNGGLNLKLPARSIHELGYINGKEAEVPHGVVQGTGGVGGVEG